MYMTQCTLCISRRDVCIYTYTLHNAHRIDWLVKREWYPISYFEKWLQVILELVIIQVILDNVLVLKTLAVFIWVCERAHAQRICGYDCMCGCVVVCVCACGWLCVFACVFVCVGVYVGMGLLGDIITLKQVIIRMVRIYL